MAMDCSMLLPAASLPYRASPCPSEGSWGNGVKLSGPKVKNDQPDANRLVLSNNLAGHPLQFYWHDITGG